MSMLERWGWVPTVRKISAMIVWRSSFILPAAILQELLHSFFRGKRSVKGNEGNRSWHRAGLKRLRKNSLDEGHAFSRASKKPQQ